MNNGELTPTTNTPATPTPDVTNALSEPIPNEVISHICHLVETSGISLSTACKLCGCDSAQVYTKAKTDSTLQQRLTQMRQLRAHALADGLTDALDNVENTIKYEDNPRKSDIAIRFQDMKLRHVQWLIERTNPEYSNKQEIRIGPADSAASIEAAWTRRQQAQEVPATPLDQSNKCAIQSNNTTPIP